MVDRWDQLESRIEQDIAPNTQSLGKLLLDLKNQVDWIRSRLDFHVKGEDDGKAKANSDTLSDNPKPDGVLEEKQS